jgi:hypothetical protein
VKCITQKHSNTETQKTFFISPTKTSVLLSFCVSV